MKFNQTQLRQLNIHMIYIQASINNRKVAEFEDHRYTIIKVFHLINTTSGKSEYKRFCSNEILSYIEFNGDLSIIDDTKIYGKYMDQTYIHYSIETLDTNEHIHRINCSIVLLISEPQRLRDKIFKKAIPFIIMIVSIQMGMLLDMEVLKELARRPIQPVIGFICQYGFMPLIAFAISKIFRYNPIFGLGLFVVGCCPGGTQSNQWAVVFDGDLNLSTFMSFVSTVASFLMMPLWLYTLGQYAYLSELKIYIPFWNLAISLLTIIAPLSIGMLMVYFIPRLKPLMERIVKPILIVMIFYFFVFGAAVNFYLFYYIDLRTALTCPLLPWLGYVLGGGFAWICGQDWKRTMTIGIETGSSFFLLYFINRLSFSGTQNIGIAIMILIYSLPPPTNSQATIIPIIVAYLSPQPFYLILIYQLIRQKCCPKKKQSVRRISIDTISKTTFRLSEPELEPIIEISPTKKPSLPLSALDITPNSESLEIK
jgi:sodium/bile acid cotransporter 3/5